VNAACCERESWVLRVEALGKRFGASWAVRGLSFAIGRGQIVALLGANGAGKTTTLAMILGLVEPSEGRITLFGHELPRERYRALHRVNFSSPYVDLPARLTVRQNLRVYAGLYGVPRPRERVVALCRELGIEELLDRPTGRLSAGQKSRVALAKALINRPQLLVLDEPTASLDPETAHWVRGWLVRYARSERAALLLASHNMQEVERMADQVLLLRRGRLWDRGRPEELLARHGRRSLEEVFLAMARADGP